MVTDQKDRPAVGTASDFPAVAPIPRTLESKGLAIQRFGPLPEGFDPVTASARELAEHRLPRRPEAADEAHLLPLWERTMGRTRQWITPEFEHRDHVSHGPARLAGAPADAENATSGNWSGAAAFAPQGKPYRWVGGQWTVPSPHTAATGDYWASEWVGVDGWNSPDVMQAGTETHVTKFGFFTSTDVYAWWEWYPAGEVRISNLPVSPGDLMYCLICTDALSTAKATVYFSNQSTGVGTRFDITAPGKTALAGNVAEWIVERPSINGSVANLTDYGACYFDECLAGGSLNVDDLASAMPITMTGTGGAALSDPNKENDHVLKVTWRKSS